MTAANWVTAASLIAGTICFLLYCWATVSVMNAKSAAGTAAGQAKSVVNPDAKTISVTDFTKLLEALGGLTDSLSKASPSLTSLIGAVLMFAIAAVASGAITSPPPKPPETKGSTATGGKPSTSESKPASAGTGSSNTAS